MRKTLIKLRDREIKSPRKHPEVEFLAQADLNMTGWKFDKLMDQGRKALVYLSLTARCFERPTLIYSRAWRSGKEFAARYSRLMEKGEGVFSRSSGGQRVVETGRYWLQVGDGTSIRLD